MTDKEKAIDGLKTVKSIFDGYVRLVEIGAEITPEVTQAVQYAVCRSLSAMVAERLLILEEPNK